MLAPGLDVLNGIGIVHRNRVCAAVTKAARELSRAACAMNCRRVPVPFITCANNQIRYAAVSALPLFLHFELLDQCNEVRRDGSREGAVFSL
jgi:hypothetical protein